MDVHKVPWRTDGVGVVRVPTNNIITRRQCTFVIQKLNRNRGSHMSADMNLNESESDRKVSGFLLYFSTFPSQFRKRTQTSRRSDFEF